MFLWCSPLGVDMLFRVECPKCGASRKNSRLPDKYNISVIMSALTVLVFGTNKIIVNLESQPYLWSIFEVPHPLPKHWHIWYIFHDQCCFLSQACDSLWQYNPICPHQSHSFCWQQSVRPKSYFNKTRFHHFINAYINFRILFFSWQCYYFNALENHGS